MGSDEELRLTVAEMKRERACVDLEVIVLEHSARFKDLFPLDDDRETIIF